MLACEGGTIDQRSVFVSRISGLNLFNANYINESIFNQKSYANTNKNHQKSFGGPIFSFVRLLGLPVRLLELYGSTGDSFFTGVILLHSFIFNLRKLNCLTSIQ